MSETEKTSLTGREAVPPLSPPDLSLVMPCYNEEECVGYTVPRLLEAFERSGYRLELVTVDNGSVDRTGDILQRLAERHSAITYHRIETNEGYGHGILSGFPLCSAPWVGIIPADGQVDAEDAVFLFRAVLAANWKVLGKTRRRFRMDGLTRKGLSIAYNLFAWVLWPGLGSLDLNGNPKILPRDALNAMDLKSKGWLLDPEIMIKAHCMGLRILEFSAFARMRSSGLSHVRVSTCFEFFWSLLQFRFSPSWRKEFASQPRRWQEARERP